MMCTFKTQLGIAPVATSILMLASGHALAERWVNVGAVQPVNVDLYADSDSATRSGDLAKIRIKSLSDAKSDEISFDCIKNFIYDSTGMKFSTEQPISGKGIVWPVSLTKNIQSLACKRRYEIWK